MQHQEMYKSRIPHSPEKKAIPFVKMQGCGNDYVYVDTFQCPIQHPEAVAVQMADRHFGVGGDGLVLIGPSEVADARMRMFNLDGSEGMMCGNAIRCVGKYLHDIRGLLKETVTVETRSGIKTLALTIEGGIVTAVRVHMGQAILRPQDIPVALDGECIVNRTVRVGAWDAPITCLSMGNPHCVLFCEDTVDLDTIPLETVGPLFEHAPFFPNRINTEFIRVLDSTTLRMRVWERGSGETWACGTGACASVVAAVLNGYCAYDTDVRVILRGGTLTIRYTKDGTVTMTGPAAFSFEGIMYVEDCSANTCTTDASPEREKIC